MTDLNAPSYKCHPIASEEALARKLCVAAPELQHLARRADHLYRGPILQKKRDGRIRLTYDALPSLKRVQDKIQKRLLQEVEFPGYLMGGIRDPDRTRGYIRNAQRHAGAHLLVGEDVEDFFPSVNFERVRCIFLHVFHFPDAVAILLAKLCTRRGSLAQGAITSTYLANLALYREEPELYRKLSTIGASYTRFVDDMHASVRRRLEPATLTRVVGLMRGALERAGLRPKRKKQFIACAGSAMQVHRLNVSNTASRDRKYRRKLRDAIFNLERLARGNEFTGEFDTLLQQAGTRVGSIASLNPGDARRLKARLRLLITQRRAFCRRAAAEHVNLTSA